jgi:hypothetical protein
VKYWLPKDAPSLALVLITTLLGASWVAAPAQAGPVYTINQSGTTAIVSGENSPLSDTVSGTITTDGTIGILQPGNILGWHLNLIDNFNAADDVTLMPLNSSLVEDVGSGLSASATDLSFNFSDSGAEFLIQGTAHGAFSGFQYFCFSATGGACAPGETIVPDFYAVDGVKVTGLTGTLPLNPPPLVSNVPEPATLSLFGAGIAGIGLVKRRKAQ